MDPKALTYVDPDDGIVREFPDDQPLTADDAWSSRRVDDDLTTCDTRESAQREATAINIRVDTGANP